MLLFSNLPTIDLHPLEISPKAKENEAVDEKYIVYITLKMHEINDTMN